MSIISFIKNMRIFRLGRNDLIDKLRSAQSKLNEVVLPMLSLVIDTPELRTPQSAYGKAYVASFLALLPSSMRVRDTNPTFTVTLQALNNLGILIQKLDDVVKKELPETIYVDGITYQKASILRLIDVIDFVVDYSSKQLAYYVRSEMNVQALNLDVNSLPYTKLEETTIKSQQAAYLRCIDLFYLQPDAILAKINAIPEVLVDVSVGDKPVPNTDPLKMGIIPLVSNGLLFLGERKVDWEYSRYERAKKERRDLELALELFRQRAAGKTDARTEHILNGYKTELAVLRQKISSMEQKALGDHS